MGEVPAVVLLLFTILACLFIILLIIVISTMLIVGIPWLLTEVIPYAIEDWKDMLEQFKH